MEGWITIQLTERGEIVLSDEPKLLEKIIKKFIKSEYFFPVYYNKSKSYENRIYLFKGYIFIKYNKNESRMYTKFSNSAYFIGPLLVSKRLYLTPDLEIQKLKKELKKLTQPKIKNGDKVRVIDGKYKNLIAEVTEFYPSTKEADLKVALKCMNIIVPRIPSVCLQKIIKNPTPDKKLTLQNKILDIIKMHPKGLTRKDLIYKMDLTDSEVKRVSTSLSRALKKEIIECCMNDEGKSVFTFKR